MSNTKHSFIPFYLFVVLMILQMVSPSFLSAQTGDNIFAITNVQVFDGEQVLTKATVIVKDGKINIVTNDDSNASGLPQIDGNGKTLIPGLIDAHVHLTKIGLEGLLESARFGVTTVLEMFTTAQRMKELRNEIQLSTDSNLADYYSSGAGATVKGGYGSYTGVPVLSNADEAAAFIAARIEEGSDYIKLLMEYGSPRRPLKGLDESTITALIKEAHKHDTLTVAHVSKIAAAKLAVKNGIDGLAHIWTDKGSDRRLSAQMSEQGVFVIPTIAIWEKLADSKGAESLIKDSNLSPFLSNTAISRIKESGPMPPTTRSKLNGAVSGLKKAGVRILAGTDSGNPGVWYGVSLHRELELLVDAGLSPIESLKAATSVTADVFQLSDRGRIMPGKRADLILLNNDPTVDILATRDIDSIWIKGQLIKR